MAYENAKATMAVPTEPTINERLNRAAESLYDQCERIERVLSRVNGTPQRETGPEVAKIRPTRSMLEIVESLDGTQSRLRDLASGIERIA